MFASGRLQGGSPGSAMTRFLVASRWRKILPRPLWLLLFSDLSYSENLMLKGFSAPVLNCGAGVGFCPQRTCETLDCPSGEADTAT